jgi:hypothetical protein
MVDLLKAVQKLRRRARTSRDFMEVEPFGLPFPQVVTCAHNLLEELFSTCLWDFASVPDRLGCYFGLWFPKLQFQIAFTSSLLVFSNHLQGLGFLARSSGFRARLITIGAVVLWLQGSRFARSESLDHLHHDLHNSTYHLPTVRSGLSTHYLVSNCQVYS